MNALRHDTLWSPWINGSTCCLFLAAVGGYLILFILVVFFFILCFPEIAASFAKGVHFNTFGGNPVACAIASSVLDVRIHNYLIISWSSICTIFQCIAAHSCCSCTWKLICMHLIDNQRGRRTADQSGRGHLSDDRAGKIQRQVRDHRWRPWKRPADRCGNGQRQGTEFWREVTLASPHMSGQRVCLRCCAPRGAGFSSAPVNH